MLSFKLNVLFILFVCYQSYLLLFDIYLIDGIFLQEGDEYLLLLLF